MDTIRLGRTNLTVSKNGFGALPVQRTDMDEACRILRRAFEGGINYFDTARMYTDSEEKIGKALGDVRDRIIISISLLLRFLQAENRYITQKSRTERRRCRRRGFLRISAVL